MFATALLGLAASVGSPMSQVSPCSSWRRSAVGACGVGPPQRAAQERAARATLTLCQLTPEPFSSMRISSAERLAWGKRAGGPVGWRMSDAGYLIDRAQQELSAAIRSPDCRARNAHLDMADAYLRQLREDEVQKRRRQLRLVISA
jgi:hypothetical protein